MEVEATADYFSETAEEPQLDREALKTCCSDVAPPASSVNGCFDCNICLDFTVEPVVTLCGHLYCWPCIYKWLQQAERTSPQQCPVCKASLSCNSLVPLYGRGHSTTKQSHQSLKDIPRRPSILRDHAGSVHESPRSNEGHLHPPSILQHRRQHYHRDRPYNGYPYGDQISLPPSSPLGTPRMVHPMAGGLLGGMAIAVLPWVFRNQEAGMGTGMYYSSGVLGSPRLRRQEMRVERSLHQIWVFLFCCAVLCLLFF